MAALLELGFSLTPADPAQVVRGKDFGPIGSDFVQIGSGPFELDLVFAPEGIESFDAALRNAKRVENVPVRALSAITASKRAAGIEVKAGARWREVYGILDEWCRIASARPA